MFKKYIWTHNKEIYVIFKNNFNISREMAAKTLKTHGVFEMTLKLYWKRNVIVVFCYFYFSNIIIWNLVIHYFDRMKKETLRKL